MACIAACIAGLEHMYALSLRPLLELNLVKHLELAWRTERDGACSPGLQAYLFFVWRSGILSHPFLVTCFCKMPETLVLQDCLSS